MWIFPFASLFFFIAIIVVGVVISSSRTVDKEKVYFKKYQFIISEMEKMTRIANEIRYKVEKIDHHAVYEHYEVGLKGLEALLSAMKGVPPLGTEPSDLDVAESLLRNCRKRIQEIQTTVSNWPRSRTDRRS